MKELSSLVMISSEFPLQFIHLFDHNIQIIMHKVSLKNLEFIKILNGISSSHEIWIVIVIINRTEAFIAI